MGRLDWVRSGVLVWREGPFGFVTRGTICLKIKKYVIVERSD